MSAALKSRDLNDHDSTMYVNLSIKAFFFDSRELLFIMHSDYF